MIISLERIADCFNAGIENVRASRSVEKMADCGDRVIQDAERFGSMEEFDRWRIDGEIAACSREAGKVYEQLSENQQELNSLMMEFINIKLEQRDFSCAVTTELKEGQE